MVGLYIVLYQFNTTKRYKMIVQINSYQYSNISKLRIFTVCMSYGVILMVQLVVGLIAQPLYTCFVRVNY